MDGDNRMHVVYVSFEYPGLTEYGGVGRYTEEMATQLVLCGHFPHVLVVDKRRTGEEIDVDGVAIHYINITSMHWYATKIPLLGSIIAGALLELERSFAVLKAVKNLVSCRKCDIVEVSETSGLFLTMSRCAVPVVLRLHGELYTVNKMTPPHRSKAAISLRRLIQRFAIGRASLLTSPSNGHYKMIREEIIGRLPECKVVPNMIRGDLFNAERKYELVENSIIYVGGLSKSKGLRIALEMVDILQKSISDVKLYIAGVDPEQFVSDECYPEYQHLIKHTVFLGRLKFDELIRKYQSTKVCVIPSYYETFSYVALEAMSSGCVVVASNTGGLSELIEDGISGLLVQPGKSEQFASSCNALLENEALRACISESGRKRAKQYYSSEISKSIISLYRNVVEIATM
ncbi:MAG: glycosyltransferase family 4 protein [Bacteroidota bacterium]